jgi:hypothetical protein
MNKMLHWLKSIRIDRIITAFLVGILVFVSTACSGGVLAKTTDQIPSSKTADQIREEVPSTAVTNEYKGGMNEYSDVDPRFNPSGADTKAKGLVDNAKRNIDEKSVDSVEQYVENYRSGTPLGERVKRIGEDVGEAADNVKEEASKGAKENLQNTKETAKDTAKNATRAADDLADSSKSKVKTDVRNTQRALDDAADKGESLGAKIKQSATDAADTVKSTVNKAADAID